MTVKCIICGKEFEVKNKKRPAKTCSLQCRGENQKIINRWKRQLREKQKEGKEKELPININEICKIAKQKGMTYGQVVAERDKKLVKVRRLK